MNDLNKDIEILKEHINFKTQFTLLNHEQEQIEAISNVLSELETYKKIAEKLAETMNNHDIDEDICRQMGKRMDCTLFDQGKKECIQCIIDWARNEVEKDV